MAYKQRRPIVVSEGGTGNTTLTIHSVLLGNSTSAITQLANGTTGQILTAVTGLDPAWASPAASSISITGNSGGALTGAAFTFTGGTTGLTFSGAGTTETLTGTLAIANGGTNATSMTVTDGTVYFDGTRLVTTATGTSGQILTSAGAGVAPAYASPAASSISITGNSGGALTGAAFTFTGGTTGLLFSGAGTTETLTGTLAIANGGTNATSMATTDGVVYYDGTRLVTTAAGTAGQVLTSNGAGVAPTYQAAAGAPAVNFQAYLSATDSNVTGDGTNFQLGSGNAFTIVFNTGSAFTTGGVFTAPSTGTYCFNMMITTGGTDVSHTTWQPIITTTGNSFTIAYINGFVNAGAGGFMGVNGSAYCQMTSGNTCTFNIIVSGGTKVVDILDNAGLTYVGGFKVS